MKHRHIPHMMLWNVRLVPVEAEAVEELLYQWISKERFVAFPKISGVGLNEMAALRKLLAIFVLDDKDSKKVEQSR